MKFLTKSILTAAILMTPVAVFQASDVSAKAQEIKTTQQAPKAFAGDLDVSQGWDIVDYSSDLQPDVDNVFKQGHVGTNKQKGVFVQVGNMGNTTLTAKKTLPMQKGHTYDLDLIYAQAYTGPTGNSTGYIDFNGEKIMADNDPSDKHYTKTITATEDMNYVITISFTTEYPDNAYVKLGYDMTAGDGITDTPSELEAPIVTPNPEAGTKFVSGTAGAGNTVEVSDATNTVLGTAKVGADGKYQVTTSRALHYQEKLNVVQKSADKTSPIKEVEVLDTLPPEVPILDVITDEDMQVTGETEPYADVYVTFETGTPIPAFHGKADGDGKFTIVLDQTFPGNTKLTASAIDEAKNESEEGNGVVVFKHELEVHLATRKVTTMDTHITGTTTRPNCDITIEFGTRIYTGKSDADGKFSIAIDKHDVGSEFTVTAVDPNDVENPAEDKGTIYPRIPLLENLNVNDTTITGEVDPGADVYLEVKRGENTYSFTATADGKGNFSISLKDDSDKPLSLTVGDALTYHATKNDLVSDDGNLTIYGF